MKSETVWDFSSYSWMDGIRQDVIAAMTLLRMVSVGLSLMIVAGIIGLKHLDFFMGLLLLPIFYWMMIPLVVQVGLVPLSIKRMLLRKSNVERSIREKFTELHFPSPEVFHLKKPEEQERSLKELDDFVTAYLHEVVQDKTSEKMDERHKHAVCILQYLDSLYMFPGLDSMQIKMMKLWLQRVFLPSIIQSLPVS